MRFLIKAAILLLCGVCFAHEPTWPEATNIFRVTDDVTLPEGVHDYDTIVVDGTLRFDPIADTELRCYTLWINHGGRLVIGGPGEPALGNCTITIKSDRSPSVADDHLGPEADIGIVCYGTIEAYGIPKQRWIWSGEPLSAGQTVVPTDSSWLDGDMLTIPTTKQMTINQRKSWDAWIYKPQAYEWHWLGDYASSNGYRYEFFHHPYDARRYSLVGDSLDRGLFDDSPVITAPVSGKIAGQPVIGNLSSNVKFRDESWSGTKGHLAFVGDATCHLDNIEISLAGRTQGIEGSQIGRYSVHFHHMGDATGRAFVTNCGVYGDRTTKWGIVHHQTDGAVTSGCVVDGYAGSGIVCENAFEAAIITDNLVCNIDGTIKVMGHGFDKTLLYANPKLGAEGAGYWLATRAICSGNVAVNCRDGGFSFVNGDPFRYLGGFGEKDQSVYVHPTDCWAFSCDTGFKVWDEANYYGEFNLERCNSANCYLGLWSSNTSGAVDACLSVCSWPVEWDPSGWWGVHKPVGFVSDMAYTFNIRLLGETEIAGWFHGVMSSKKWWIDPEVVISNCYMGMYEERGVAIDPSDVAYPDGGYLREIRFYGFPQMVDNTFNYLTFFDPEDELGLTDPRFAVHYEEGVTPAKGRNVYRVFDDVSWALTVVDDSGNEVPALSLDLSLHPDWIGEPDSIPGDIDGDGRFHKKDFDRLYDLVYGYSVPVDDAEFVRADLTGDGLLDVNDLVALIYILDAQEKGGKKTKDQ